MHNSIHHKPRRKKMSKSKFWKFLDVFEEFCREMSPEYHPRDILGFSSKKPSAEEEFAAISYLQSNSHPSRTRSWSRIVDEDQEDSYDDDNDNSAVVSDACTAIRIGRMMRIANDGAFRAARKR
jgi:hypothetical protein